MPKYIDPAEIKFIGDTFTDADKETYIRLSDVKQAIAQTPAAATSPCDLCRYNPPSSMGGKPCGLCPACGKE